MVVTTVRLTEVQAHALRARALRAGFERGRPVSLSALVRRAVDCFLTLGPPAARGAESDDSRTADAGRPL